MRVKFFGSKSKPAEAPPAAPSLSGAPSADPPSGSEPVQQPAATGFFPPLHDSARVRTSSLVQPLPEPGAPPQAAASVPPPALTEEQKKQGAAIAKLTAATFGEAVAVLMQSKMHRGRTLADLETLLLPAIRTGQILLAEAQSRTTGQMAPVGLIAWASVSDEIDRRLTANPAAPMNLTAKDWTSGPHLWIVEAAGPPKVVNALLKRLQAAIGDAVPVKVRTRSSDGAVQARVFGKKEAVN